MDGIEVTESPCKGLAFFEFLEGLPVLVLPCRQPVRAATMNDCGSRTRATELDVFGEDIQAVAFHERLVFDEALTKCDGVRVLGLGGWADGED